MAEPQWENDTNYFLQPVLSICFIQFQKEYHVHLLFNNLKINVQLQSFVVQED